MLGGAQLIYIYQGKGSGIQMHRMELSSVMMRCEVRSGNLRGLGCSFGSDKRYVPHSGQRSSNSIPFQLFNLESCCAVVALLCCVSDLDSELFCPLPQQATRTSIRRTVCKEKKKRRKQRERERESSGQLHPSPARCYPYRRYYWHCWPPHLSRV